MAIMVKMDKMAKMGKMDRMVKMNKIMKPRIQLMKVTKPPKSLHPPRLPYTALSKNKLDISNSLDLNFQRSQVFESFCPIFKKLFILEIMKIFSYLIFKEILADEANNCLQQRLDAYCQSLTIDGDDRCMYAGQILRLD